MARQRIKIISPLKGYDERWSRGEQPEGTWVDAINVLTINPANGRAELAQREGCNLATYFDFVSGIIRPPEIIIDPGSGGSSITVIPIPPGTPVVITSAIVDDGTLPDDGSGGEVIVVTPGGGDPWTGGGGGGEGGGGSLPGGGGGGGDPIPIPKKKRRWTFTFWAYYDCITLQWVVVVQNGGPHLTFADVGETPWEYVMADTIDDGFRLIYEKRITIEGGTGVESPAAPATPGFPSFEPSCAHVCSDASLPLIAALRATLPATLKLTRIFDGGPSIYTMTKATVQTSIGYTGSGGEPNPLIDFDCELRKWTIYHWTYGKFIGPDLSAGPKGTYTYEGGAFIATVS